MIRFIQPSFWFDRYPWPFLATAMWIALGVFVVALALGIWFKLRANKTGLDKLSAVIWGKFGNWSLSLSIVGLILLFFKQQRVPYLGMRAWLGLWLLICLVWLGFIVKYIIKEIPRINVMALESKLIRMEAITRVI